VRRDRTGKSGDRRKRKKMAREGPWDAFTASGHWGREESTQEHSGCFWVLLKVFRDPSNDLIFKIAFD
jgi:hypothetical protein